MTHANSQPGEADRALILCAIDAERARLAAVPGLVAKAEIVCTGPGIDAVLEYLIANEPAPGRTVIMAGLAGALHPKFTRGQALVGQRVMTDDGEAWMTTWPVMSEKVRGLETVKILTSQAILHSPRAKLQAREVSGADLVDTESSALAAWASTNGNPFGVVRGVFDTSEDDLPATIGDWIGANGKVNYKGFLLGLLQEPSTIRRLGEFARRTHEAMDAVARVLEELL